MNDGLILAWYGVQRNGIKSFGISGPDTIDVEVLLLQIPGSACLYFRADLVSQNRKLRDRLMLHVPHMYYAYGQSQ